jgi:AraC-like DNA-binding protein
VEYVNAHFTENINVTTVSQKLYVSRSLISSVFLKFAGIPLTEYIHVLRIEYANNLLRDGADVMSAAYDSGFSSIRTFNSVYKRIMKVTPTQYIKDEM